MPSSCGENGIATRDVTRWDLMACAVSGLGGQCVEGAAELLSLCGVEPVDQVASDGCRMDRPGGFGV